MMEGLRTAALLSVCAMAVLGLLLLIVDTVRGAMESRNRKALSRIEAEASARFDDLEGRVERLEGGAE